MPTLILIRHGENDFVKKGRLAGRLPGVHLNERGRTQAAALGAALKSTKLAAIYTSPLDRAVQTAQAVASPQGIKITKRPNLAETDLGDWQGKTIASLRRDKRWRNLQERPAHFRFPGGESMLEQQARLIGEVQELLAKHKAKDTIACVGHGDPLKLIIAHYLGMPLDYFQRIILDTASATTLRIEGDRGLLIRMNWTAPLAK